MSVPHPSIASSDAFLAALVNSSGDAILSKSLKGVITSWNKGAERIFGYTAAEMIGQPVTRLFPPERIDEEVQILARIGRGESVEHYETVRLRQDGALIDVSLTVSPILGPDGTVVGASKVARDITAQKQLQERFRVTLTSIGDAVIATDASGRVTFMNTMAEKLTRWPEAEAMGQPLRVVFQIVDEITRAEIPNPVDRVIATDGTVGLADHTLLIARDRTERPIDDSAAPIRDDLGALVGIVLVFRDASDRRVAELAGLRLAAIIEGSDDAIVGKNLQGIVTNWNPGAERLFGYTAAEMIGRPITRLLPPDRPLEEQQILAQLQRGERVDHFETRRVRKDGTQLTVSLTISPIRDVVGRIIGASKIARDITGLLEARERLRSYTADLEAKVRERTQRLEESVAELEAFSYSLSHDLRAPLRAIQSFTEMVLQDYGDRIPEGADYLRRVVAAASRMDLLIRDVLAFARVSQAEIQLGSVDVEELIRALIRERPYLQPPQAQVTIQGELPRVIGHVASLTQCFGNLLENGVKFVAPGVEPKVEIFAERHGDRVRLSLRDNGIGIDPAGQEQLFSTFRRLRPAKAYHGTGVGLAIVRKAVHRMNGSLGVTSTPGDGSTFWIELALA